MEVVAGKYRIVQLLGEGGMGRVFEAEQPMGQAARRVAVKMLREELAREPVVVTRFLRECETASTLDHPNVVRVFDFGRTAEGQVFLVMELAVGPTLADEIRRAAPFDFARAERIVAQIASALADAHARGVVHRDLKPENLVLTSRALEHDVVKIIDFGIAARAAIGQGETPQPRLTQRGAFVGSPLYMAPEQITSGTVDPRTDVYALALITYEMLVGQHPFDADSTLEVVTKKLAAEPLPFDATEAGRATPATARAAIARALASSPLERTSSVLAFYEELTEGWVPPQPASRGLGSSRPPPSSALELDRRSKTVAEAPLPDLGPGRMQWAPVPLAPVATEPGVIPPEARRVAPASRSRTLLWAVLGLTAGGLLAVLGFGAHRWLAARDGDRADDVEDVKGAGSADAPPPPTVSAVSPVPPPESAAPAPLPTPQPPATTATPQAPPDACALVLSARSCAEASRWDPSCRANDPRHHDAHAHTARLCGHRH